MQTVPMAKAADLRNALTSVRRLGPWRTAVEVVKSARARLMHRHQAALGVRFDRRCSVQTNGMAELHEFTITEGERDGGIRYEGMCVGVAPYLWAILPADLSSFTFVDFGVGKGRAVLLAAELGFGRIIGVEFAHELCEAMRENIRSYTNPKQRCFDIEAVCTDAARFEMPGSECVLFFFNPFKRETLQKVAANIEASYRCRPRRMIILYYHPSNKHGVIEILNSMPSFRQRSASVASVRFRLLSPFQFVVYESDPKWTPSAGALNGRS